jgi:hypothetical protein
MKSEIPSTGHCSGSEKARNSGLALKCRINCFVNSLPNRSDRCIEKASPRTIHEIVFLGLVSMWRNIDVSFRKKTNDVTP